MSATVVQFHSRRLFWLSGRMVMQQLYMLYQVGSIPTATTKKWVGSSNWENTALALRNSGFKSQPIHHIKLNGVFMSKEAWKDVVGFEDYFMISSLGSLYSKRTNKNLKLCRGKVGYVTVVTKIGGRKAKSICLKLHRLVAEAFIENPDLKPFVNHKNGIKHCNDIGNLEWCTAAENVQHAHRTGLSEGRKGVDQHSVKLTEADVISIRACYIPRHKKFGSRVLAKRFNVSHKRISSIVNNKSWTHI